MQSNGVFRAIRSSVACIAYRSGAAALALPSDTCSHQCFCCIAHKVGIKVEWARLMSVDAAGSVVHS